MTITYTPPKGPQPRTLDLLEDVDWMLTTGETPLGILRRTGHTADNISQAARRYGYPHIARIFARKTHA